MAGFNWGLALGQIGENIAAENRAKAKGSGQRKKTNAEELQLYSGKANIDYTKTQRVEKNKRIYETIKTIAANKRKDLEYDRKRRHDKEDANELRQKDYALNVQRFIEEDTAKYKDDVGSLDGYKITKNVWDALDNEHTRLFRDDLMPYTADSKHPDARGGIRLTRGNISWAKPGDYRGNRAIVSTAKNQLNYNRKVFEAVLEAKELGRNDLKIFQPRFSKLGIKRESDGTLVIPASIQKMASEHEILRGLASDGSDQAMLKQYINVVRKTEVLAANNQTKSKDAVIEVAKDVSKEMISKGGMGGVQKRPFEPISTFKRNGKTLKFSTKQKDMQRNLWNSMDVIAQKKGVTIGRHHKAAILSNAFYESSFKPDAINQLKDGKDDNPTGIFQIRQKMNNLQGMNLKDPIVNLEAILTKVWNGKDYSGAFGNAEFMNSEDAGSAASTFAKNIERMEDKDGSVKRERSAFSNRIFKSLATQPVVEKPANNDTDSQTFTKNIVKRTKLNFADALEFRNKIASIFDKLTAEIDVKSMIGTSEKPNNENIEGILQVKDPRYGNIIDSDKTDYEKAEAIIKTHNLFATKSDVLQNKQISNNRKNVINKGARAVSVLLNGEDTYTTKDRKKTIQIPTMPSFEKLQEDVQGAMVQGTNKNDIKRMADPNHKALWQLYTYEVYLSNLAKSKIPAKVELAKELRKDKKHELSRLIKLMAGAKPFRGRATWNLKKHNLAYLSEDPDLAKMIETAANLRDKIIVDELEKNKIIFKLTSTSIGGQNADVYVPRGTPQTAEQKQKMQVVSSDLMLPNLNNDRIAESISFGPAQKQNSLVATLAPNSKIEGGTNTSPRDLLRARLNLKEFKGYVNKELIAEVDKGLDKELAVVNFLNKASEDSRYKDYSQLFSSSLIDALAYAEFYKIMSNAEQDFIETGGTQGIPVKGKFLPDRYKVIVDDKVKNAQPEVKEANAITPFMNSAHSTAKSLIAGFEDVGVLTLAGDLARGQYSPRVNKIYNEAMNSLQEDKQTVLELRNFVEQNLLTSDDPQKREDGTLIMMALRRSGAGRSSSIAAGYDTILTRLGSIGSVLTTSGKALLDKVQSIFFDSHRNEIGAAKKKYNDQFKNAGLITARQDQLDKAQQNAEERMNAVLKNDNASADEKKLAILTARRTFDAITLTYQFAGMIQGGSGGRAISNEDFENMWKALWGGDGVIQASNVRHVMGIIEDISQRVKIIKGLAHRGTAVIQKVLDRIVPIQRGYRKWKRRQQLQLDSQLIGASDTAMGAVFGESQKRSADQISSYNERSKRIYQNIAQKNYTVDDMIDQKESMFDLVDPEMIKSTERNSIVGFLNHLKSIPIDADLSGMRKSLPQRGGREYLFGQTRSENGANVEDMNISNLDGFLYANFLYEMADSNAPVQKELVDMLIAEKVIKEGERKTANVSMLVEHAYIPQFRTVVRLMYASTMRQLMRRYLREKGE